MPRATDMKTTLDRNIEAMGRRPQLGKGTATTCVTLRLGSTACEIEDGPWRLLADLDRSMGGEGGAPDPGVFGRAALGSCMVMGYELWAARLGVRLVDVRVTVESDFDARGMYAVDDALTPGWLAVRCTIEITSPDPHDRVAEVVEKANRYSPLMADISRPVPVSCEVRISTPAEE